MRNLKLLLLFAASVSLMVVSRLSAQTGCAMAGAILSPVDITDQELVIMEYAFDETVPGTRTPGPYQDGDLTGDALVDFRSEEYVELLNVSECVLDMNGVSIFDAVPSGDPELTMLPRHIFPLGFTLSPGQGVVVFGIPQDESLRDNALFPNRVFSDVPGTGITPGSAEDLPVYGTPFVFETNACLLNVDPRLCAGGSNPGLELSTGGDAVRIFRTSNPSFSDPDALAAQLITSVQYPIPGLTPWEGANTDIGLTRRVLDDGTITFGFFQTLAFTGGNDVPPLAGPALNPDQIAGFEAAVPAPLFRLIQNPGQVGDHGDLTGVYSTPGYLPDGRRMDGTEIAGGELKAPKAPNFPQILEVTFVPEPPAANEPVVVTAEVTDDATSGENLEVVLTVNETQNIPMTFVGEDKFEATIPGAPNGALVNFSVNATDDGTGPDQNVALSAPFPTTGSYFSGVVDIATVQSADAGGNFQYLNITATVEGVVTIEPGIINGIESTDFYIQDETAGSNIVSLGTPASGAPQLNAGDIVRVKGQARLFGGPRLEFVPLVPLTTNIEKIGDGTLPDPIVTNIFGMGQPSTLGEVGGKVKSINLAGTGLDGLGRGNRGLALTHGLVRINGVKITGGEPFPESSLQPPDNAVIEITDNDGFSVGSMVIFNTSDLDGNPAPTEYFDVIGVVRYSPAGDGTLPQPQTSIFQIVPARSGDLIDKDVTGNGIPVFTALGPLTAEAGREFTLGLPALDPDGDPLTFAGSGPENVDFDLTLNGVFTFTPSSTRIGETLVFEFAVSDGRGGVATTTIAITVVAQEIATVSNLPILISETVVTPDPGEFVEIFNPNDVAVDLSNYYITDASFVESTTDPYQVYYNIVKGPDVIPSQPGGAGGGTFADWNARFPAGSVIESGEYQTLALRGSDTFAATYGVNPTYEILEDGDSPDDIPDMLEAVPTSIIGPDPETNPNTPGLSSGEMLIVYSWNGVSDLVQDSDYIVWQDKAEATDKTGVVIDGIDADDTPSAYRDDVSKEDQDVVSPGPHASGKSFQRIDISEGEEIKTGGNGVTKHNEMSENLSETWVVDRDPTPNGPASSGPAPILISETVVTPDPGEFVEIFNPNSFTVDLTNYYITDASFVESTTDPYQVYYNIVKGPDVIPSQPGGAGGGTFADWNARFPAGSVIESGEYQTLALRGSDTFTATYGVAPTYEILEDGDSPDDVPDMLEAVPTSIIGPDPEANPNSPGLSSGEMLIVYSWDGISDLVQDSDYIVWQDKAEATDKTGVVIDGIDADDTPSAYRDDVSKDDQDVVSPGPHAAGASFQRVDFREGKEIKGGGNGVTGHNEMSENLSETWVVDRSPTPNGPASSGPAPILLSETVVTPDPGEFVEIFNPNLFTVDLTNYYITDASFVESTTDPYQVYYNIVKGPDVIPSQPGGAGGGTFADWNARFPAGATIKGGEYQTLALRGSDTFNATYGVDPTYEILEDGDSPDDIPDMLEAVPTSIIGPDPETNPNTPGLSSGEMLITYSWNGVSDLVQDSDYIVWQDKAEATDKTGVVIDGIDADDTPSAYLDDVSKDDQDVVSPGPHAAGKSFQRIDLIEGREIKTGGNGVTGHNEMSENLSKTWTVDEDPTPNSPALGTLIPRPFAPGDVNLDGEINVLDVLRVIDIIIGAPPAPSPDEFSRADLTGDAVVNVGDLAALVRIILTGQTSVMLASTSGEALQAVEISLANFDAGMGDGASLPLSISLDAPALLATFEISFDEEIFAVKSPLLAKEISGMKILSSVRNGKLVALVYSENKAQIPAGETTMMFLPVTARANNGASHEGLSLQKAVVVGLNGEMIEVSSSGMGPELPRAFALNQNYPNPFNPSTTIIYDIPAGSDKGANVLLEVYNVRGQMVRRLVDELKQPGRYEVHWNGKNERGDSLSSGVYFYRIVAEGSGIGKFTKMKKMVLLK